MATGGQARFPRKAPHPEPQPPTPAYALVATGLTRRFGSTLALQGVDIALCHGERVALLGPNGSGKTTLIRILATALRPTSGRLAIGGFDAALESARARRLVGAVGERTYLYPDLTARENLRLYGRLYGVDHLEQRIAAALGAVEAEARADWPVRTLSHGLQQRVAIARAILHDPLVLLMDEPETGLDDRAQERLGRIIDDWAGGGRAVLVASHRLDWAHRLADRTVLLRQGRVVGEASDAKAGVEEATP